MARFRRELPMILKPYVRHFAAASQADMVLTSGGVSVGEADFTKQISMKKAKSPSGNSPSNCKALRHGQIGKAVFCGLPVQSRGSMVTFTSWFGLS